MFASLTMIVCPTCHAPLAETETALKCEPCKQAWPIRDGIPYFMENEMFWAEGKITQQDLQDLVQGCQTKPWKDMLKNHPAQAVRDRARFISNPDRTIWHSRLSLPKDSRILDVGAGMGAMSESLARQYAAVVALEPVKERCEFMQARFRQEGLDNIAIVKSDLETLPFPHQYFDLIMLNGVLEWVPFSRKDKNPRQVQIDYLRLLRKHLKPGGVLYVGIENRTYYRFFRGYGDPHVLIPWVTILPRYVAHLVTKMKTGDIYRPYLYSSAGYRKLMEKAGYGEVTVMTALPSYNDPQKIEPLSAHSRELEDWIFPTDRGLLKYIKKLLIDMDILKFFGFAYLIFARN